MKKEHLFSVTKKDFKISKFSGRGAGGQHRNKHQNCIRLLHPESGARGTGQSSKSLKQNMIEAFRNLRKTAEWKIWFNKKIFESIRQKSIEQIVEGSLTEENIKTEIKVDGKWKETNHV